MSDRLSLLRPILETHGQTPLLAYLATLAPSARAALLDDLESIDFAELTALSSEASVDAAPTTPSPAPYLSLRDRGAVDEAYRREGDRLVAEGRVAAFTVAGGQGTRLGWGGPKGTYPATAVTGKPLFRVFAEQLLAVERRCGAPVPWYIMTSPENDAATRAFFADNNYFGLARGNILMFPQGTMPSIDRTTGVVLLSGPDRVARNPDGHGGSFRALRQSGALEDMQSRGIEQISYFQVDNPLVRAIDPFFLGAHIGDPNSSGEMSSKMVAKRDPDERVGVFAVVDARTAVIEYSDLADDLAHARDEDGTLRFDAGSIAVHLVSLEFARRLTAADAEVTLPFHRAIKKVPHIDLATGDVVDPAEPNAVKFEMFVFDAIPLARKSLVIETDRAEEFAPIKNAAGADSVTSSHTLQTARAARWLEAHGVRVPRADDGTVNAKIEISPLTALEPADLAHAQLPASIERGEAVVL